MYSELFKDVITFRKYNQCLGKLHYKVYKEYLKERLLKECTVKNLQTFMKRIFNKPESTDTSEATIDKVKDRMEAEQQTKYERKFGEIVINGRTHLELKPDEFCTKEEFRKEFKKDKFTEFRNIEDLSAEDCADIMLEKYLESYTDDGWLILKDDKLDKIKKD